MINFPAVLVDSSVWVKFFRSIHSPESAHLDTLLQTSWVKTCAPIRAEVLSGARTQKEQSRLRELFEAVDILELPKNIWEQAGEIRFQLARKGHQAAFMDLLIALTASTHQIPLWTLDADFVFIQKSLVFPRYLPEFPHSQKLP